MRIWLSKRLAWWAVKIAPESYLPDLIALSVDAFCGAQANLKPGYTPPLSAESNERTKRTKAKRKRQKARWRALEAAKKLDARFDPSVTPYG